MSSTARVAAETKTRAAAASSLESRRKGLFWELNPGPLAPEARIMPLDQTARFEISFSTTCTLKVFLRVRVSVSVCTRAAREDTQMSRQVAQVDPFAHIRARSASIARHRCRDASLADSSQGPRWPAVSAMICVSALLRLPRSHALRHFFARERRGGKMRGGPIGSRAGALPRFGAAASEVFPGAPHIGATASSEASPGTSRLGGGAATRLSSQAPPPPACSRIPLFFARFF